MSVVFTILSKTQTPFCHENMYRTLSYLTGLGKLFYTMSSTVLSFHIRETVR